MDPIRVVLLASALAFTQAASITAYADDDGTRTRRVNCAAGESISRALKDGHEHKALVLVIRGTCTENVVIERDDVTLQGEPGAAVVAGNAAQPTVALNGARRIRITGLAISGGSDGVQAARGTTLDLTACTLQNNARFGLLSVYNSTAIVDNCTIQNNGNIGAVAANVSVLNVTNSTVQNNGASGLFAVRGSMLRVGQDAGGGSTPGPVTVRNNAQHGIGFVDSASGIVIAATVENNGSNGILVDGSSGATIGIGVFGVTAPVTLRGNAANGVTINRGSRGLVQGSVVENNGRTGVNIEGAAGTVIGSQIRGNGQYGVASLNSGSARVGLNDFGGGSGNVIENNVLEGVHVVSASSAWLFGNTIQGNSTTNARYGVLAVENSTLRLVGLNVIRNNGSVIGGVIGGGVFLRESGLHLLKGDFTITPNTNDIVNNTGDGIQAVENSIVEARDGVTISGNTDTGVRLVHGSRMRAQATTVSGNGSAGVRLIFGSSLRVGPAPSTLADPILCADAESSVAGIPLPPGCTGF